MVFLIVTPQSIRLGIVGGGTMGSGIALAALLAGVPVRLYEIDPGVAQKARDYLESHLVRSGKARSLRQITMVDQLSELSECNVVIEAVPENLELKRKIFHELEEICPYPAILATNTSSLKVAAIVAGMKTSERMLGMHFFNPAPVLPLVEIIRSPETQDTVLKTALQVIEVMGKTPVVANDTPGFIVNRVARPFYGEALRLLGEQTATHEEIDWLVEYGGGFRMGPFELIDLIGVDVNLSAMQTMYEQSFGEPRYKPHPLQLKMVQQNYLGKKTGRGFYDYESHEERQGPRLPPSGAGNRGAISLSPGSFAAGMQGCLENTGFTAAAQPDETGVLAGAVLAGRGENLRSLVTYWDRQLLRSLPLFCQCADVTIHEVATWVENPQRLIGFDGLFFTNGSLVTLTASPMLEDEIKEKAERWLRKLGKLGVWVQDSPALVLPRIVGMLVNEAVFALQDGVADVLTIDQAMRLGVNYPYGPLEWGARLGFGRLVAVLDHLRQEYGEDRYRAAALLRRWARLEALGEQINPFII